LKPTVDIIMPVFNSQLYLEHCLKSIYRELSVNRLIVVDSMSSDDTLRIIEKFPRTEIHQCSNNLAEKRTLGMSLVETDIYCFIDSDIELLSGFRDLTNLFRDERLGGVYAHPLNPYTNCFHFFSNLATSRLAEKLGIGNTTFRPFGPCLIRKNATVGINIPSFFSMRYEDYYIAKYIREKGFKLININDRLLALHHKPWRAGKRVYRRSKNSEILQEYVVGRPVTRRVFWKMATSLPKGLYAFHLLPHPGIILYDLEINLRHLCDLLRLINIKEKDALHKQFSKAFEENLNSHRWNRN
jgi:glycosyltransferase involved in cell wall biosynthesis